MKAWDMLSLFFHFLFTVLAAMALFATTARRIVDPVKTYPEFYAGMNYALAVILAFCLTLTIAKIRSLK